uniref:ATP-dependent Clp protease proteolytic subunit n=1 Tax=Orobanche pancicii TaxID=1115516 RepID=A0A1C8E268_9LAMI|nr:Clp protease subunit [Orobanche pancicii]ALJ02262.1 Clp protease subunit [Orobanche pancicii]
MINKPKIWFRNTGDSEPGWGHIHQELFQRRILFLFGNMDAESTNKIVASIMYFHQENPTLDQQLFINSPGGELSIGLGVYQVIQYAANVNTVGLGIAAGMGCLALVAGNKRIAYPHLFVKLRETSHSPFFNKHATDLLSELTIMRKMSDMIVSAFSENTGQPTEIIREDMENNTLMTAKEAYSYGIIDRIVGEGMRSDSFDEEI